MRKVKATITVEALEEFSKIGMTQAEVASLYGVTQQRISQILKKREPREAWDRGKAELCRRLRTAQIEAAVDGHDRTMLIWLGKAYLGQVDAPRSNKLEISGGVAIRYVAEWGRSNDEIAAAANPMIEAGEDDWEEEE